jgi:hypothetical protein
MFFAHIFITVFLTASSAFAGWDSLDLISAVNGPTGEIQITQEGEKQIWKFSLKGKVHQFVGRNPNSRLENFTMRIMDRKTEKEFLTWTPAQGSFENDTDFEASISTDKPQLITALQNESTFLEIEATYDVTHGTTKDHYVQLINLNKFQKTHPK